MSRRCAVVQYVRSRKDSSRTAKGCRQRVLLPRRRPSAGTLSPPPIYLVFTASGSPPVLSDLVRDLPVSSPFDFTSFPSNSGAGRRRSPTFCTLSAMAAPASSRTSCCCCWCRSSRARIPRPCSTPSTPAHSPTPSASRTSRETSSSSLPISAVASALVRLRLIYIVLSVQLWITCVVKKNRRWHTFYCSPPLVSIPGSATGLKGKLPGES